MVFHEDDQIVQMFLIAALMELPSMDLIGGITSLMAAYYVFDIVYPKSPKATFFFLQDILMDQSDGSARYSMYIKNAHQFEMTFIV